MLSKVISGAESVQTLLLKLDTLPEGDSRLRGVFSFPARQAAGAHLAENFRSVVHANLVQKLSQSTKDETKVR